VNQDLTPKQQTSEAIRQAETILIITGQHPSVDQVSSTLALAATLRKFGKKVTALISDSLPQQVSFLETGDLDRSLSGLRDFIVKVDTKKAQVDKLRYEVEGDKLNIYVTPYKGGFAPSDVTYDYGSYRYDLVIVLGVPTRARIDRVYTDSPELFANLPIVNLDFHRSNEQYGAINLIEPMASSLAEILVALAESLQNGIVDEQIATALLTGLMSSTDRFTAAHTTAKSLTVAAQLMAAGAKQPAIVRALFRDSRSDNRPQPSQSQPRPQAAPAAPEPEVVRGPIAAEPASQPIIDPGHVELMPPVETADFTAAAEILQQRQQD
jgi:phosphoesterase RecJ-like protein